ncbi:MAG: class I mannose-6-phosphate isomerase [Microbacteriaceae bacterium]
MSVHLLGANQPADRFYRGGSRIARFRRRPDGSRYVPEDWVASTTTVAGQESLGLSRLEDGTLLAEAIEAEPVRWLGAAHLAAWGTDTKLLVKLLDAGQRLPVHVHPDGPFAHDHLLRPHGKAEAWHILEGGEVFLGLREPIPAQRLAGLVESQATGELLALLHRRLVRPGDTVFVPPGTLHAIGEGVFLIEAQEPEDLSVLLEWQGFAIDGRRDGHLGLGFDTALRAVDRRGITDEEVEALIRRAEAPTRLPASAERFFAIERLAPGDGGELDGGFAVIVVVGGDGALWREGRRHPVGSGSTLVLEHHGGPLAVEGGLDVVVLRPPSPLAADTPGVRMAEQQLLG